VCSLVVKGAELDVKANQSQVFTVQENKFLEWEKVKTSFEAIP
jgi:hypothetical protein